MSLMSGLYVGISGLQTSQRGLTATGHNLANAETEGYVRQRVISTDLPYMNIGDTHIAPMTVGQGTTIAAINQVRDAFLDKSYRVELGRQKFYEAQYEAVTEVEEILGETEGVAFQDSMEELWTSMSELCKEPESIVHRSSFIQTAVSFIERAELVYEQIKDYQVSLNTKIGDYVDRINEIAYEIQELNSKILKYESNGTENANDYRDARNLLLDELASLANISYKEQANGVVTVKLEEYVFVSEDIIFPMGTRLMNNETGMIEPYWPSYGNIPVYNFDQLPSAETDTDIGSLKGLLYVRGDRVGKYADIPVEPQKEDYTDETGYFYEEDYKEDYRKYEADLEKYNLDIDSSAIVNIQSQFDQLIHGIVTTINDILCPNKEVVTADGETIVIFDEENAPVGMDENWTPGEAIFNRKAMDRYEKKTVTIEVNGVFQDIEVWKYNEENENNNYSLFTIGEIEINPNILKNPSLIPLSENNGTGDFAVETCDKLLEAWQTPFARLTPTEYKDHNFNEYYREMIGALANRGEEYKNVYQGQETLVNSVETQRLSAMAVSSDEELTNLIRYQHAYNASARYINVLSQMLEQLLNSLTN